MRKWTIGVLFVAAVLSAGNLYGADDNRPLTCLHWNKDSQSHNTAMVWGWLKGTEAALALSQTSTDQDRDVMTMLWPRGHRVASVVVEMDVECQPGANRNQTIEQSLKNIAFKLNNARIN